MYIKPLLKCDDCEGEMKIIDTRVLKPDNEGRIYRRRKYECTKCKCHVTTLEHLKYMHTERWRI